MVKQVLTVDIDDFAQVVSSVGYLISIVGVALPDSPQKDLAEIMGDNLVDLLMKYSSEEKQEEYKNLIEILMTNEADTSVSN